MQIRLNRVLWAATALWVYTSPSFAEESAGRAAQISQPAPKIALGATGSVSASTEKKPGNRKLVDLNNATRDELKSLPGFSDVLADKVIAGRPFGSKADLVSRGIVLEGPYQSIRKYIFVGPVKKGVAGVPKK